MNGASAVLAARGLWGVLLLAAPDRVLAVSHGDDPDDRTANWVLRVLGGRHLVQTVIELVGPRPTVQYLGAVVDGIHALSSAGLAVADRRWRRSAVLDACVASGFALGTGLTARITQRSAGPVHPASTRSGYVRPINRGSR